MANFSGKYMKVWEIEDKGKFKLVNLGDSKKQKDGSYQNWTWYKAVFCGAAAERSLVKDDKINVTQGQVYQEKYNDKWYTKVVVFDFEPCNQATQTTKPTFAAWASSEDEIPF